MNPTTPSGFRRFRSAIDQHHNSRSVTHLLRCAITEPSARLGTRIPHPADRARVARRSARGPASRDSAEIWPRKDHGFQIRQREADPWPATRTDASPPAPNLGEQALDTARNQTESKNRGKATPAEYGCLSNWWVSGLTGSQMARYACRSPWCKAAQDGRFFSARTLQDLAVGRSLRRRNCVREGFAYRTRLSRKSKAGSSRNGYVLLGSGHGPF